MNKHYNGLHCKCEYRHDIIDMTDNYEKDILITFGMFSHLKGASKVKARVFLE